jgi:hypothetical protein
MSVSPDRNLKEAAPAPPPLSTGAATDRVAAASTAVPIVSVNNIEVVYDQVILALKGVHQWPFHILRKRTPNPAFCGTGPAGCRALVASGCLHWGTSWAPRRAERSR